jgi:hypothetical protein
MLAITLAFLMSAQVGTPPVRVQAPAAQAAEYAEFIPKMLPYGTAEGVWQSGTLIHDGNLFAVLEDAMSQTLYGLSGKVHANGEVSGRLYPMEYATNAALNLPEFAVIGTIKLPATGDGSISLVIYDPLEDIGYVFPHGYIEGVLTSGLRPMVKPGQPHTQNAETAGMSTPGQGSSSAETLGISPRGGTVISCPWRPGENSAAELGSEEGLSRSGLVTCPFEPQVSVTATSVGSMSKTGRGSSTNPQVKLSGATSLGSMAKIGQGPATSAKVKVSGKTQVGQMGAAGFQSPAVDEGWMFARWVILP